MAESNTTGWLVIIFGDDQERRFQSEKEASDYLDECGDSGIILEMGKRHA